MEKKSRSPVEKTLYSYFPKEHHHAVAEWISEVSYYDALYMHLDDMVDGVKKKIKNEDLND